MARMKKLTVGALNISMPPPHRPEKYIELFKEIRRKNFIGAVHGPRYGTIANVLKLEWRGEKHEPITGDIYTFTQIDADSTWFNLRTHETADDSDLTQVAIPDHLKPNSARFSYIFFPGVHTLFLETHYNNKNLSPANAARLLTGLLNDKRLSDKYGQVDVTPLPSTNKVTEALNLYRLDRLQLSIKLPNSDGLRDAEEKMFKRMHEQNVSVYEQNMKASKHESIAPSDETKTMAKIAAKNGHVYAKGRDQSDHPKEILTSKHPWQKDAYYDPNLQGEFDAFADTINNSKDDLLKWFDQ